MKISNNYIINEKVIKQTLSECNNSAKHQQDLIQWMGDIGKCICCGCHASGPHLTKTLIILEEE